MKIPFKIRQGNKKRPNGKIINLENVPKQV